MVKKRAYRYPRKQQAIIDYCQELRGVIYAVDTEESDLEIMDRLVGFLEEAERWYPEEDIRECKLFHVLVGSTYTVRPKMFDFPGELSVVRFLERLAQEMNPDGYKALIKKKSKGENR